MGFRLWFHSFTKPAQWGTRQYVNMVASLLLLILSSDNVGTPALPDYGPEVTCPDEALESSAAAGEKKSNSEPTTPITTELPGPVG